MKLIQQAFQDELGKIAVAPGGVLGGLKPAHLGLVGGGMLLALAANRARKDYSLGRTMRRQQQGY
jgi:hypothetical protein